MFSRLTKAATQLGKRKATENEGGEPKKQRRDTELKSRNNPNKALVHGEEQLGGLVIVRSNSKTGSTSSKPKPVLNATARSDTSRPTEEQTDEDIRHMEAELSQLRDRSRSHARTTSASGLEDKLPSTSKQKPLTLLNRQKGDDTVHDLPLEETPINRKNKKLRSEGGRRSSNGSRGKRLSSSLGNTGVITQPHPSIPPAAFHKHLDPTLPDALRLRHLLVWCANRNLPASSKSTGAPNLPPLTNSQRERLKVIQQDFIKSLASGKIETAVGSSVHKKTNGTQIEHEQNTKNKQRLANFLRDINDAKSEEAAWVELIHSYNTRQTSTLSNLESELSASTSRTNNWLPREQDLDSRLRSGLELSKSYMDEWEARQRSQVASPISSRIFGVQFQVDQLHETLHVSSQLASRTSRDLDSRFNQLSGVLEFNRKAPPVGPAQREIDPRELLRTIAQTDIGRAQEMGDVARMTAREVARLDRTGLQSISGQSGVMALPSTPRTPRRAGTPSKRNER